MFHLVGRIAASVCILSSCICMFKWMSSVHYRPDLIPCTGKQRKALAWLVIKATTRLRTGYNIASPVSRWYIVTSWLCVRRMQTIKLKEKPLFFSTIVALMWRHQLPRLKETNWRHGFEENSQDFFLLREFQNIREGPDTCICQKKVSKFNCFKKTRVFRKADMTAWMEQELFLHAGSSKKRQVGGNRCSRNVSHVHLPLSYVDNTLLTRFFFCLFVCLNTISMKKKKKKKTRDRSKRELTAHLEV